MTGRDLYYQWAAKTSHGPWERVSPSDQVAWERLAARVERDKQDAIAAVVARRERQAA